MAPYNGAIQNCQTCLTAFDVSRNSFVGKHRKLTSESSFDVGPMKGGNFVNLVLLDSNFTAICQEYTTAARAIMRYQKIHIQLAEIEVLVAD